MFETDTLSTDVCVLVKAPLKPSHTSEGIVIVFILFLLCLCVSPVVVTKKRLEEGGHGPTNRVIGPPFRDRELGV